MTTKILTLSTTAIAAIDRLQHKNGTYEFYASTLSRLFNHILDQSDEIGMSDTEAIHTLRVLQYLKDDIAHIAGKGDSPIEIRIEANTEAIEHTFETITEEAAEKVESTFAGLSMEEVREFVNPPQPTTTVDHVNRYINNAIEALAATREYLDKAHDYAMQDENMDEAILQRLSSIRERVGNAAEDIAVKENTEADK